MYQMKQTWTCALIWLLVALFIISTEAVHAMDGADVETGGERQSLLVNESDVSPNTKQELARRAAMRARDVLRVDRIMDYFAERLVGEQRATYGRNVCCAYVTAVLGVLGTVSMGTLFFIQRYVWGNVGPCATPSAG